MSKKDSINKITNFLALSLSHRIGNIANPNEKYSNKYTKEADNYFIRARDISFEEHWNNYDKSVIKEKLKKKLIEELIRKEHLDSRKFNLVDAEINNVLRELELD